MLWQLYLCYAQTLRGHHGSPPPQHCKSDAAEVLHEQLPGIRRILHDGRYPSVQVARRPLRAGVRRRRNSVGVVLLASLASLAYRLRVLVG